MLQTQRSFTNLKSLLMQYLSLFFFSSRRRHTRFDCDWSSDVCSSDLPVKWRLEKLRHHNAIGLINDEKTCLLALRSPLSLSQPDVCLHHFLPRGQGRSLDRKSVV